MRPPVHPLTDLHEARQQPVEPPLLLRPLDPALVPVAEVGGGRGRDEVLAGGVGELEGARGRVGECQEGERLLEGDGFGGWLGERGRGRGVWKLDSRGGLW